MDVKAMAKSKRSHTRHNQPRKPHSKTHPSSSSSSSSNPTSSSSLPSNWDRYDDLEQEGGDDVAVEYDEVVKPKSKGANFEELVAQAKESKTRVSPSLDETLPDFYQGLGPMLAVRGESFLSWDGIDDFLAEDETTITQEVPFLSLDLQALAEQLENVDLAQRLFIEEDLLPPKLRSSGAQKADNEEPFQKLEKQKRAVVPQTFDELLALYWAEEQLAERQTGEHKSVVSSPIADSSSPADATNIKVADLGFSDARDTSKLVTNTSEQDSRPSSNFEAAAAEAELDMLLGSFSETKLFGSPADGKHETPVSVPVTSSLDDALDDLLEQTSKPDDKDILVQSTEVRAASFNMPPSSSAFSSQNPSSKPQALEDFDSWLDTL